MFRPFKSLETAWNARTPVYLHNRTKENFIFQLLLAAVIILGFMAHDEIQEYRKPSSRARRLNKKLTNMKN